LLKYHGQPACSIEYVSIFTYRRLVSPKSASVEEDGPRSNRAEERFSLGEFSIDEYRPIKVIVIGAGFSGIIAGIRYVTFLNSLNEF
jgi:hypothetical protein